MAQPRAVIGGVYVPIKRREIPVMKRLAKVLAKLRNATFDIYETSLAIGKIERQQSVLLGIKFPDYKKFLLEEFVKETEFMKVAGKVYNYANQFRKISEDLETELSEGKEPDKNLYISQIKTLLLEFPVLLDEYAELEKIELEEKRYEKFFERLGADYRKIADINRKKLGALRQQGSQLSIAINALEEISEILRGFR